MANNINNLEELRREKELLKMKMKITQKAFFNSLGENRRQVQRLVVNKIALPVGAGALTSLVIQALAKKNKDDAEIMGEMPPEEQAASHWWVPIVRTLMRFLENYLNQIDPRVSPHSDNGHSVNPAEKQNMDA
jgi:hypothetical protein